jgi:hypothetical protein
MPEKQFFANMGEFISPHSLILDRLDFLQPNKGRPVFYSAKEFEESLPTFQNLPLIFARKHPDPNLVIQDLDAAIKAVDGKLAGHSSNIYISNTGSPKLQGDVEITDPDVEQLIKEGKIYVSNAFQGRVNSEGTIYGIAGNHVLLYPTDTGIPPGDLIATFLNQGIPMAEDTKKTEPSYEFFMNQYEANVQTIATQKAELDSFKITIENQGSKISELEGTLKDLNEKAALADEQTITIQNQGTKILELEEELKTLRADKIVSEREAFLNQGFSKGVLEQFKPRFSEYDSLNTRGRLINDMWKAQAGVKEPPTEPSGEINVLNQGKDDDIENWLDGVDMAYDHSGKVFFGGAK